MTLERHTVSAENLTVSLIVWRRFRRHMPGLVERVLDSNPGLSAHGPYLALGTTLILPIDPPPAIVTTPIVNIWD